jgi:DNA-binding transcriptional MerR regulator
MSKSRDAFRTISEVADLLDTPAHVLRFWESKFTQVKPVKRAGGRRYYRPGDISLLSGIRTLLYDDGLTIKGVQKVLREQGVKHVAALAPLQLDEAADAEDSEVETIEDAPFVEAQPESGTVLPFAPMTAPKATEAPASAATPVEAAPSPLEAAPYETDEPPAASAEAMPDATDAALPDAQDPDGGAAADLPPESAPAEAQSEPAAALRDEADRAREAGDGSTIAEHDGPVPDFLAQSLEDRQDDAAPALSGEEPVESNEAASAFEPLPEQPYGAHPKPDTASEAPVHAPEATEAAAMASEVPTAPDTSQEAPQDTPEDTSGSDTPTLAEPPLPVSRALPDLPDPEALPVPPAGALRHLARLDRLGASEAAALAAPVAALRDWLARSDDAARHG